MLIICEHILVIWSPLVADAYEQKKDPKVGGTQGLRQHSKGMAQIKMEVTIKDRAVVTRVDQYLAEDQADAGLG